MTGTRRDLLKSAALGSGWLSMTQTLRAAPGAPAAANEEYWRVVKQQFPLKEDLLYLNAANVCPASRGVLDRHAEYMRDFQANPSFQNREKYEPLSERARQKAAALLGCGIDEIAFMRNTSEGSNLVVHGIDLKPGDEVVITSHNHPSNNDSWKMRAKRDGIVIKEAVTPIPAHSQQELIDGIAKAMTPRTRVVAITHVTSTTGNMYPAREIGDLAHKAGCWFHLDGAQSLGALDVNVRETGCDSYTGSSHKWMMGPLEAGILYVKAERIEQLWPAIVTAGWSDHLKGARKFEVFGQRDNPRLVAVEATLDFLNLIGMKNVEARMRALATRTKENLRGIPTVNLKTSLDPRLSGGVIKFDLKNMSVKKAYDILYSRNRLAIAITASGESQGLRFSPHIYNTMEEVDRATAAVKELVG